MFSQQNNVEMGIYISKVNDEELYKQVATEVDRIKRGSEHRTISVQKVDTTKSESIKHNNRIEELESHTKVKFSGKYFSATALSKELGISIKDLTNNIEKLKWIEKKNDEWVLTNLGKSKGAEIKKGQYGDYIAYPDTVIKELLT
jgi:hypothetical protein